MFPGNRDRFLHGINDTANLIGWWRVKPMDDVFISSHTLIVQRSWLVINEPMVTEERKCSMVIYPACIAFALRTRWKYGGCCSRVTVARKLEWRGMKFMCYLIAFLLIWSISLVAGFSVRYSLVVILFEMCLKSSSLIFHHSNSKNCIRLFAFVYTF